MVDKYLEITPKGETLLEDLNEKFSADGRMIDFLKKYGGVTGYFSPTPTRSYQDYSLLSGVRGSGLVTRTRFVEYTSHVGSRESRDWINKRLDQLVRHGYIREVEE